MSRRDAPAPDRGSRGAADAASAFVLQSAGRRPPRSTPAPGSAVTTPPAGAVAAALGAPIDPFREFAVRLQAAREEERTHLARELHDEIGQALTSIQLEIALTVRTLRPLKLGTSAFDRLQCLVGLVDVAAASVRRLSTALR